MPDLLQTPFFKAHEAAGGKLVDFAGWTLPIHYGSLVDEHNAVRTDAGMFDVSHMTVMDVRGDAAIKSLRNTLTNDIATLSDNTALYSCLCRENGGVVDDLIVYRITVDHYRVISNASTREKVLSWLAEHGVTGIDPIDAGELAMLAVQGPNAVARVHDLSETLFGQSIDINALPNFGCALMPSGFVGRTGYTGEDGVEIIVPKNHADSAWQALLDAGVTPCGLGARDTLRLEAAMSLYGNDLDDDHSPVDCGVGWTVDLSDESREFVGRDVLQNQKRNGSNELRIGLELAARGVLRAGQVVRLGDRDIGVVTSGTFSPTLQRTIALARVQRANAPVIGEDQGDLSVVIRDKPVAAFRVKLPFLRSS